ncbi:MAG: response regulator [Desulfonatronovibrio sp.]
MHSHESINESIILEQYFEIIPFDIYVVDVENYEIVYVNARMRKKLPASFDPSTPCYKTIYQDTSPCLFCNIQSLVQSDWKSANNNYVSEIYDEYRQRWMQMHEKIISWPDGRIVKYAIGVDISEVKDVQNRLAEAHAQMTLMNRELQQQNEILEENIRLREDVDRMTRHDLKTPLTPIINYPRIILEDTPELSESNVRMLSDISRAGVNMLNMINRTLDLFRLEQGTYEMHPVPCDIIDILNTIVSDLKTLVLNRNIGFDLFLDERPLVKLDVVMVLAESMLCYSLFSNLLKNAIEASPDRYPIIISIRSKGKTVEIEIENQGEIPEKIRSTFFDKYVTAGKSGTGLGTYSARLITEAHGGAISLDTSKPGRTAILVRLPSAPPSRNMPLDQAHEKAQPEQVHAELLSKKPGENIRILLVEDYLLNQELIMRFLSSSRYDVDLAQNGNEAVELFGQGQYDLVLMDVQMPVINGYEATRRIRNSGDRGESVPIIAMTAHSDKEDLEKCQDAGMNDYLAKPVNKQKLISIVDKWTGSVVAKDEDSRKSGKNINNLLSGSMDKNIPLDHAFALKQLDVDEEFLRTILEVFLKDAGQRIAALEEALDSQDFRSVILEAHTIKGGAANIAAVFLSEAAGKLEKVGLNGDFTKTSEAFAKVRSEYNRLKGYLEKLQKQNHL